MSPTPSTPNNTGDLKFRSRTYWACSTKRARWETQNFGWEKWKRWTFYLSILRLCSDASSVT